MYKMATFAVSLPAMDSILDMMGRVSGRSVMKAFNPFLQLCKMTYWDYHFFGSKGIVSSANLISLQILDAHSMRRWEPLELRGLGSALREPGGESLEILTPTSRIRCRGFSYAEEA